MKHNYKIFTTNDNGKIEFTPAELNELLESVYSDGYSDGNRNQGDTTRTLNIDPYWHNGTTVGAL